MMQYRKQFIALDLETTDLDMETGRIMEIGAVKVELVYDSEQKKIIAQFGEVFDTLVNPEVEPSPTALMLTGITRTELAQAPLWSEVKQPLKKFLGTELLLGHNLGFDLEFLRSQGLALKNPYLDSLEMAQVFLPLLPAHSLEFLVETFQIRDTISHRALADSRSSSVVLAEILNEFLSFGPKLKQSIRELLGKTQLDFRDWFLDLPEIKVREARRVQKLAGQKPGSLKVGEEFDLLEQEWPPKTLVVLPLSFSQQEELLMVLSKRRRSGLLGIAHEIYLNQIPQRQKLANPEWALCEKRLDWAKSREKLSGIAGRSLIKIAIFRDKSESLDLSELKWNADDHGFLDSVLADPDLCPQHQCGYFQSLKLKKNQIYGGFLQAIFSLGLFWPVDFTAEPVFLMELSKIEEEFTEALTTVWNLRKIRSLLSLVFPLENESPSASWYQRLPKEVEKVANELDLFFGILHLVYLKQPGAFAENILVDEEETGSERFGKLLSPAEKLVGKLETFVAYLALQSSAETGELKLELLALQAKLESFKNFVKEFFLDRSPEQLHWFKFNSKWVDLNLLPTSLAKPWQDFAQKFRSLTLLDAQTPESALKYFQDRLGLSDLLVQKMPASAAKFSLTPVKIATSAFTTHELFELTARFSGRSLLVVPNETQLAEVYEHFFSAKSEGAEVIAYKYSGNLSLLKSKFAKSPNIILILTTNVFLRVFVHLPPVDQLVLLRLPFEAPGTKHSLLGSFTANVFADHVLPRAVQILHTILSRVLASGAKGTQVYLLDPRTSTDYNQAFVKYLQEFPDFQISTIDKG